MSKPEHRHRYGGPWFAAASALPLDGPLLNPRRTARLLLASGRHPERLVALLALLLRSPTVHVELSESAAGQLVREHLNRRSLGVFPRNRMCRGVLMLPEHAADYLPGRRRRTVRTNLRRAAAAGIRCETADCPSEALSAAEQIIRGRRQPTAAEDLPFFTGALRTLFGQLEVTLLIARDQQGCPSALMAAVTDAEVCLIRLAISRSHEARWALHHHLVLTLINHHVKYLLAADGGPFGALAFPSQVQHFQHLHGYELCHVVPREAGLQPHLAEKRLRAQGESLP